MGDRGGETTTLNNMAAIYFQEGDLKRAADSFRQIITIAQQMGASADESLFRFNLAVVFQRINRIPDAIAQVERSIQLQQSVGLSQDGGGNTIERKEHLLAEWRGEAISRQSAIPWWQRLFGRRS